MKIDAITRRRWAAALVGAALATGLAWALQEWRWGLGLQYASYDLLHVVRGDIPAREAAVVYLDEISHEKLNQPRHVSWDRALHARLIDRLTKAGARAIVFDVVFSDENPTKAEADAQLVTTVKNSARVILGAENIRTGPLAKTVVPPFDALLNAAAGIGSVEIYPDRDLTIRKHTPENPAEDQIPHLSWAAAEWLKAPSTQRTDIRYAERWVHYYGAPGTIRGFSYYECLDPTQLDDSLFRDRVIFVGARLMTKFAGDRKDEYRNPYSSLLLEKKMQSGRQTPFMAGVEVQATMFLNLLRGDWLTRWTPGTELAILLILGALAGAGLVWLRPVAATIAAAGVAGGILLAAYGLFVGPRIWFPWLIPLAEVALALSWSLLFNSVQLYVQKRLQDYTLRLFLPPTLVKKFSHDPALLKPGAKESEITIFFSDIADFTNWSQGLEADELAHLMNGYFETAVAKCIHRTEGTLVKYIGDAIFAIWNAPDQQVDHARRACEAALHFRRLPPQRVRGQLLITRIGIHTGRANVGNFGSTDRVDYTALGENVNLASRLEGLNKYLGTDCLLSRATRDQVGDAVITRRLGHFQLKGFDQPVEVFELLDWANQADATRPWREAFEQALANFEGRDIELAQAGFQQVLELRPGDVASKHYLSRIEDLQLQNVGEEWATHTIVREK